MKVLKGSDSNIICQPLRTKVTQLKVK